MEELGNLFVVFWGGITFLIFTFGINEVMGAEYQQANGLILITFGLLIIVITMFIMILTNKQ
jgi:hypothetical protein